MEDLFAPTTRFRDLYHALERDDDDDEDIIFTDVDGMDSLFELELVTGSPEDTFLHCGYKWSDFYSLAHGKIVWISPDVFFNSTWIDTDFTTDYQSFLHVRIVPDEEDTGEQSVSEFLGVCARSEAHATVASNILLQLLTTCESSKVRLENGDDSNHFPVSGLAFSHFLVQSRNLRVLDVRLLRLDTCHCRAIDACTLTRTDLQIELFGCETTEPGEEIMLECIRQNRGPTELSACRIDTRRLADALRGNSSVTTLAPHKQCSDEERLALVQALVENVGLVTLNLSSVAITDEIWIALWQSVARHPKLEKLVLPQYNRTWRDTRITDVQIKTLRMQTMVDALRGNVNTLLHTIELNRNDFDEEILDSTVYPLLLANRYRPRAGAISSEEGPLRCKLLGRALGSIQVSSNPSLIWMFFSGNANVRLGRTPLERES